MNVEGSLNVIPYPNISDSTNAKEQNKTSSGSTDSDKDSSTIYAGDLNISNIKSTKLQAQKKALKTILEQFQADMRVDQSYSDIEKQKQDIYSELDIAAANIKNIKAAKASLKDTFQIEDDSKEQKDIELIEKSLFHQQLTSDDITQLSNMGPITDYQKYTIEFDKMQYEWQKRINKYNSELLSANYAITGIKLAKLKTHPMVDARNEAIHILETASNQVIDQMTQQMKENIDDNMKEMEEDAKKQQEANPNNDPSHLDQLSSSIPTDLFSFIDNLIRIAKKLNVPEEEIKGIVVDEEL